MNASPFTPPPAPGEPVTPAHAPVSPRHWWTRQRLLMAYRAGETAALCRRGLASLRNRGLRATLRIAAAAYANQCARSSNWAAWRPTSFR